jgi:DnaJ-class molecular chaperone
MTDTCPTCKGSGSVPVPNPEKGGMDTETCDDCGGSGKDRP